MSTRSGSVRAKWTFAAAVYVWFAGFCAPVLADLEVAWVGPVAARAGLEVGDRLQSWQSGDADGPLGRANELWYALHGPGRRAGLSLTGTRAGQPGQWKLSADTLDLHAFSDAPVPALLSIKRLGATVTDAASGQAAAETYLAQARSDDGQATLIADLLLSQRLAAVGASDPALAVLRRAQQTGVAQDLVGLVWRHTLGRMHIARGDVAAARAVLADVPTFKEGVPDWLAPADMAVVAALIDRARGSLEANRGEPAAAEVHFQDALARLREIAPVSGAAADARRDLGTSYAMRGDMASAEFHYVEALSLDERIGRDTGRARTLNNLGIVSVRRGDIAGAERYYQQALALNESFARWRSYATNLFNLADLATARQDYDSALALLRRARDRFELDEPGGFRFLQTQLSIANALTELGQLDEAVALYRDVLARYEAVAPGNEQVASVLLGLGDAARLRGDLDAAVRDLDRARALRAAAAPGSVEVAEVHQYLAAAHADRDDPRQQRVHLDAALAIYRDVAPTSVAHAQVLYALAGWLRETDRRDDAIDTLLRALDVLDAQMQQLGGTDDARALFADSNAPAYRELIDLLVDAGRHADAFDVTERYRARSMLGLLAQRDQSFSAAVDAQAAAVAAANRAYDRAQQRFERARLEPGDGTDIATLREALIERRAWRDSVRQLAAPSLPEADQTQRATLEDVQAGLAPGTLVLSVLVHELRSTVFAVTRDELVVTRVPLGRDELIQAVERLRALIVSGRRDPAPSAALVEAGHVLYRALLQPSVARFEPDRLLIIPDGPLHQLPFAALSTRAEDAQFVVERWPIRRALSLTLHRKLSACPTADPGCARPDTLRLATFSAPDAGATPLPYAGAEVDAIERLFGANLRRFDGVAATERNVLRAATEVDILHFAAHATLASGLPLDSALELTPEPPLDNGRLQVWEVFEQLRTDAALVMLSACDSARGLETAGDGLIGLARAFHFAGAASVVATQWPVADRAGAFFAEAFYRAVLDGLALDDALQQAQLALLNAQAPSSPVARWLGRAESVPPGTRAPFYWAAFELSGQR